jgi:hypothetical protein
VLVEVCEVLDCVIPVVVLRVMVLVSEELESEVLLVSEVVLRVVLLVRDVVEAVVLVMVVVLSVDVLVRVVLLIELVAVQVPQTTSAAKMNTVVAPNGIASAARASCGYQAGI